ncbi:hypothetical protein [Agrobacterium tumefaciens]|uniref:hypothetical protein n=1 Tax=Agrobacterium tumefaciens TaxID=358 RepID=UPI0009765D98|nr:hypothetical protein BV900_22615 [Agrobacterium tumefaciens]
MNIVDRVAAAKKAYDDAMNLGAMQSDAFSTAITTALALTPQLDTFPVGPHAHSITPPIQPQFPPVRDPGFSHSWTLAGGSQVPSLEAPAPANGWRCFHCDEVFFTANDARLHFGMDQCSDPACKIKMGAEKSLLVALRRAETELQDAWAAIHNENTEAAKAYYAQQSRHGEQLRAAEELGFERGIKDSTAHIAALEEQALRDRKLRDEAQQDALLWKYSVATDDHPPLLVTIWNQRKEVLGALHDLCEAYAACNGEDHAAYIRARAAISGQLQPDPPPSALANAANDLASWAGCINWRGGENQKDWLDELRQHIESVQALCKPYLPKSEATP